MQRDPVELCADVTAAWHTVWLHALGIRSERSGGLWRAVAEPPLIYFAAITLQADVRAAALADVHGTVCDSWSSLALDAVGFELRDRDGVVETAREPWFLRPPVAIAVAPDPPGLEVVRAASVAEVAEFEAVSVRGFGGDDASVEPGSLHPPAILGDDRMTMLIGRVDGSAVAAAMSYRTGAAVGIYGVTTVGSARRRGYATALTRALIDASLPAILSPSPDAASIYRRLGFDRVGELRQWTRR